MKKFFKELGRLLASILQIAFILYSIPLFILNTAISILNGKWYINKSKLTFFAKALKFTFNAMLRGKNILIYDSTIITSVNMDVPKPDKIVTSYRDSVIRCYIRKFY